MSMKREQVKSAVRRANRDGYNLYNTVSSQLFLIANNDLGAIRVYWDWVRKEDRRKRLDWKPNQIRDGFVASVRTALAKRVDHAYMLPQEQRFAAETFRVLADYAEQTDWDNKKGFEDVRSVYDGSRKLIEYRIRQAQQRTSDLRLKRVYLMAEKGLPYTPVAL